MTALKPHCFRVIPVITKSLDILEEQNCVFKQRTYPLAGRFTIPLKQSMLINSVTGKEAIAKNRNANFVIKP